MKYLIPALCVAVYILHFFVDIRPLGFTADSPLYTRLTYMFVHIGMLHLAVNLLCFYTAFRALKKFVNQYFLIIAAIFAGFLSTFTSENSLPTVGLSGVIFFLVGFAVFFGSSKQKTVSLLLSAAFCVAQCLIIPNVNWKIHLLGLAYGMAAFLIYRTIRQMRKQQKIKSLLNEGYNKAKKEYSQKQLNKKTQKAREQANKKVRRRAARRNH